MHCVSFYIIFEEYQSVCSSGKRILWEASHIYSVSAVPRNADFSLDVGRITEVVKTEKPKCIFLTSPNNPDGR